MSLTKMLCFQSAIFFVETSVTTAIASLTASISSKSKATTFRGSKQFFRKISTSFPRRLFCERNAIPRTKLLLLKTVLPLNELFGEELEKLFLSRTQEGFKLFHAETSSSAQHVEHNPFLNQSTWTISSQSRKSFSIQWKQTLESSTVSTTCSTGRYFLQGLQRQQRLLEQCSQIWILSPLRLITSHVSEQNSSPQQMHKPKVPTSKIL